MSAYTVVSLLGSLGAEQIPFLSLQVLVHEHIVRFVGSVGEDVPETYGASLMVIADVMPIMRRWSAEGLVLPC